MLTIPTTRQECENLEQEILNGIQEFSAELDPYVTAYIYGVEGIEAIVDHKWRGQMYHLGKRKRKDAIEFTKSFFVEKGRGFQVLANSGWFLPFDMPIGQSAQLDKRVPETLGRELRIWFSDRLADIECNLVDAHLDRARFFREGLEAHKEGRFGLSVLCFLSQADGISYDRFGANIFSERIRIKNKVSKEGNEVLDALFHSLEADFPIWRSKGKRNKGFNGLSRHLVLHGVDKAYDTEENSLKALSFLWWIHHLTDMWEREH